MSKKNWLSAEELLAQLRQDPDFQRGQAERDRGHQEHGQRVRASSKPVVQALSDAGFVVDAVDELAARYAPLSQDAVDILLSWLPRVDDESVQEMIVRALAATTESFDGIPLARVFEAGRSESLRWAIGNTLALAHPTGLADWVIKAVTDPRSGKARETLALASAKLAPPEIACRALAPLIDEFPVSVAQAFALCGGPAEASLLESHRERMKGWQKKEFDKAIRAIKKRPR
jgi:hypothetical protein